MTDKTFYLVVKAAGIVSLFALNAADLGRFETDDAEKLPADVKTHIVEKLADLHADFITTKDLLALYNLAADRNERPKLSKFQDKPSAMERTFPVLGEAADVYPPNFLALFGPESAPATDHPAVKAAKSTPKPKPAKADAAPREPKAATFKERAPKAKVHPCRAGTKQAALVDALAKGATMEQLRAAVAGGDKTKTWTDSSIKSALYWDINSQKGYGVKADANASGELVYSITYPKGTTGPLPHTPAKSKKA